MVDRRGERRPPRRRGLLRRDPVPARWPAAENLIDGDPDDPPDDGSAGVREPRRPKPVGPVAGAGAAPEPEPGLVAVLPDPRY